MRLDSVRRCANDTQVRLGVAASPVAHAYRFDARVIRPGPAYPKPARLAMMADSRPGDYPGAQDYELGAEKHREHSVVFGPPALRGSGEVPSSAVRTTAEGPDN